MGSNPSAAKEGKSWDFRAGIVKKMLQIPAFYVIFGEIF